MLEPGGGQHRVRPHLGEAHRARQQRGLGRQLGAGGRQGREHEPVQGRGRDLVQRRPLLGRQAELGQGGQQGQEAGSGSRGRGNFSTLGEGGVDGVFVGARG